MEKIILAVTHGGRGNLGDLLKYVCEVTEKSIKTIDNDCYGCVYDRATGRERGIGYGMDTIGAGHLKVSTVEEWLKKNGKLKNGVYVWKSSFKFGKNSRGERVKTGYTEQKGQSTYAWLKENGFRILDLRSND